MLLSSDTPIEEIFWGFITFETQTFFPQYTPIQL